MPPQITCASALPCKMKKDENCIFTQMLCQCIAWIQPTAWFLHFFDSRLILTTLYDSLSHVINAFSPQGCWGHGSGERKSRALQQLSWTVLLAHCTSALSSGFPISHGNAEALERWGGKTKHRLISYFLSNTSAKNYHNQIVYVKSIASQRWDVFWDTVYNRVTHIFVNYLSLINAMIKLSCRTVKDWC